MVPGEAAVGAAEVLAAGDGGDGTVQVLGGMVLYRAGKAEEALALLGKHEGNRMLPLLPGIPGCSVLGVSEMS